MNGEDPQERPEVIRNIINGLERYNPEASGTLESYLEQQCADKFTDSNANRALLKLCVCSSNLSNAPLLLLTKGV